MKFRMLLVLVTAVSFLAVYSGVGRQGTDRLSAFEESGSFGADDTEKYCMVYDVGCNGGTLPGCDSTTNAGAIEGLCENNFEDEICALRSCSWWCSDECGTDLPGAACDPPVMYQCTSTGGWDWRPTNGTPTGSCGTYQLCI